MLSWWRSLSLQKTFTLPLILSTMTHSLLVISLHLSKITQLNLNPHLQHHSWCLSCIISISHSTETLPSLWPHINSISTSFIVPYIPTPLTCHPMTTWPHTGSINLRQMFNIFAISDVSHITRSIVQSLFDINWEVLPRMSKCTPFQLINSIALKVNL